MSSSSGQVAMMRRVAKEPTLRRIELSYMAFAFSEHATWLAILVYALQQGGPTEVGIVAVAQLIPGVLLAPFAAYAGDRFPPQRALAAGYGMQAIAMLATAGFMASGATLPAYIAGGVAATCITFSRPAMASLLPTVTHAPSELVAANVVTGFIEQVGVFAGPLVAGVLMTVQSPTLVFTVAGVTIALGAVAILGVRGDEESERSSIDAGDVVSQIFAGFATLRRERVLRIIVLLGASAGFVKGIGDVIFVTFADARLSGKDSEPGLLAAAYGIGALLGAAALPRLMRSNGIGRQFLVGASLAAIPLLALAGLSALAPAMLGFLVLGAGETTLQLFTSVNLQRQAPAPVLARVFGILEAMAMGSIAVGSLAISVFVGWTSLGTAFVVLAAIIVCGVALGVWRLGRSGFVEVVVDDQIVDRLLADPIFAPLSAPTIEQLARGAERRVFAAGEEVISEGGDGDGYFLILDGTVDVSIGGEHVRDMGPGRSFGEIALLRDIPRTATVIATSDLETVVVSRDDFLEAVTGHPRSHRLASQTIDDFLS